MPRPDEARLLARLCADGVLRDEGDCHRTTARWQAALARAAVQLWSSGDASEDLRVPIAAALVELYGSRLTDAELVDLVNVLTPIEAAELDPRAHLLRKQGAARSPHSP